MNWTSSRAAGRGELKLAPPEPPSGERPSRRTSDYTHDYLSQLKLPRKNSSNTTTASHRLLDQTPRRRFEKKNQELLRNNEDLHGQLRGIGQLLSKKRPRSAIFVISRNCPKK
jgi:hypothetical protein